MKTFNIFYKYELSSGKEENFTIEIDSESLLSTENISSRAPFWTRLDYHQCKHCPLAVQTYTYCPLSIRLVPLINFCKELVSYDKMDVTIITSERTIINKNINAQRGVSSFMGLIIATSGCPHSEFFKPMARFHLPFASEEETIYRATSLYLLYQFFIYKKNNKFDFSFSGLQEIYNNMHTVNITLANRIRAASNEDLGVNALILLDLFTKSLPDIIEESLEEIKYLFNEFADKLEGKRDINYKDLK